MRVWYVAGRGGLAMDTRIALQVPGEIDWTAFFRTLEAACPQFVGGDAHDPGNFLSEVGFLRFGQGWKGSFFS